MASYSDQWRTRTPSPSVGGTYTQQWRTRTPTYSAPQINAGNEAGGRAPAGGGYAAPPTTTQPGMSSVNSGWWNGGQTVFPWGSGSPNYTGMYGNAPGGAPEAQSWLNVMLPWYQQAQQQQQFGSQMEQNRWAQEGAWGITREQMAQEAARAQQQEAYQRWYAQGGWQQLEQQRALEQQLTQGGWQQEMARLQAQLQQEKALTEGGWQQQLLRQTQAEAANQQAVAMQTFGRRWMPNTRWM